MTRPGYTHIAMVLDRSGSMDPIRSDVQGGVDRFVREQRELPGEATFELYTFDDRFDHEITPRPIVDVAGVTLYPRGSTALLDALGKSITMTGEWLAATGEADRPEKVVFVIVTDGLENASREWTRQMAFDLITRQRDDYQWEFVFLAANQDAIATATDYGIRAGSTINYDASNVGETFSATSAGVTNYRSGRTRNVDVPDEAGKAKP